MSGEFLAQDLLEIVQLDEGDSRQDVGVQVPAISTTTTTTTLTPRIRKPKNLACLLCGKMYGSNSFLQRHLVSVHRLCKPVQTFKCEFCNAAMSDRNEYEAHMLDVESRLRAFLGPMASDDPKAEVGRKRCHPAVTPPVSSDQSMEEEHLEEAKRPRIE